MASSQSRFVKRPAKSTIEQLLVLAKLESLNTERIHMSLTSGARLTKLNSIAIRQMQNLTTIAARIFRNNEQP